MRTIHRLQLDLAGGLWHQAVRAGAAVIGCLLAWNACAGSPADARLAYVADATPVTFVTASSPSTGAGAPDTTNETTPAAANTDDLHAASLAARDMPEDGLPLSSPPGAGAPLALDDKVLSGQRGGAAGFMMISTSVPLLTRGNGVTLWDEIAPPLPLPQPSDAARAAQGNNVTYLRK